MCGKCTQGIKWAHATVLTYVLIPYHCVGQVGVAVKLVLHQIVQHLKQEEHQLVVGLVGEQEPGRGERLDQVKELAGGRHGEGLNVGRDVGKDGQQALKQGLQPLVSSCDDLSNGYHDYQYL